MKNYKKEKFVQLFVLISITFGLGACNNTTDQKNQQQELTSAIPIEDSKKYIHRPFPKIPVGYEEFLISNNKATEIVTKEGSIIRVPANILVDKNGNRVKGKVNIKYKEHRDMVDVFLSGIPMKYDSAGEGKHFESAGMFEIRGETKDGEEVFIEKGKDLTVDFALNVPGDRFNMYTFSEAENKWKYLGKDGTLDKIKNQERSNKALTELKKGNIQLAVEKAEWDRSVPKKVDASEYNIRVVFDPEEYPELAVYKSLRFQVLDKKEFNPKDADLEWISVDIEKKEDGVYALLFSNFETQRKINCTPVFEGEDYDQALETFEAERAESKELISKLEKEQLKKEMEYQKRFQEWDRARVQDSLRRYTVSQNSVNNGLVMRQFQIENFGVYNSDCPRVFPKEKILFVRLKDKSIEHKDSIIPHGYTYLVDDSVNALYTYYNTDNFGFNPKRKNLLWTITNDNKLAVLRSDDFDKMERARDRSQVTVPVEVIDVDFESEDEIRKYLEI